MRSTLANIRLRSNSYPTPLHTVPPVPGSSEYSPELAATAARILYRSPLPSRSSDLPVFILDAAAIPTAPEDQALSGANEEEHSSPDGEKKQRGPDYFDRLLPYVLARLPSEEELIGGLQYEIVFFAGGSPPGYGGSNAASSGRARANTEPTAGGKDLGAESRDAVAAYPDTPAPDEDDAVKRKLNKGKGGQKKQKKNSGGRPGFGWLLRVYQVLSRALRKRLQKLWIVHEKGWIRVLMGMFAAVVSPKFRKKVVHVSSLSALALHFPLEDLLIPPTAYAVDRRKIADIHVPYASGKRAFGVVNPLPTISSGGNQVRLPRVLRETTRFLFMDPLLDTEGLFRVSAKQQTVEVLREAYDRGQKFIVWREGDVVMSYPHHREGHGDVHVPELVLNCIDGYDVHTAAGLIKLWYKELREPVFPTTSYQALEKFYSNTSEAVPPAALRQMLNPGVEFSPLNEISRQILTRHLLPLLSAVAEHSSKNKMTASNLAVCFAPGLICGPDPLQDMKMLGIIRNILTGMIEHWASTLAPGLDLNTFDFLQLLETPEDTDDRDEALEEPGVHKPHTHSHKEPSGQVSGTISLLDNENEMSMSPDMHLHSAPTRLLETDTSDESSEEDLNERIVESDSEDESHPSAARSRSSTDPPPLPPRQAGPGGSRAAEALPALPPRPRPAEQIVSIPESAAVTGTTNITTPTSGVNSNIHRKPAPPQSHPPRYSSIISPAQQHALAPQPGPHSDPPDDGENRRFSTETILPAYQESPSPASSLPPRTTSLAAETTSPAGGGGGGGGAVELARRKPVPSSTT